MNRQKIKNAVNKTAKCIGLFFGGVIFLLFFIFICLRFDFVEEEVKRQALERINPVLSSQNIQVTVEDLDLNLPFSVRLRNVEFFDKKGKFLGLESLTLDSRFWALLRYRVVIPSIEFNTFILERLPELSFASVQEEDKRKYTAKEQFEGLHVLLFGKYVPSVLISNLSFKNAKISPVVLNSLKKSVDVNNVFFDSPIMINSSWTGSLEKELLRLNGDISAEYHEKKAKFTNQLDISPNKIIRYSAEFVDDKGLLTSFARNIAGLSDSAEAYAGFSFYAVGTLDDFEIKGNARAFDKEILKDTAELEMFFHSNPLKGELTLQAKPVVQNILNNSDINAKITLDTFSVTAKGERLKQNEYMTVEHVVQNNMEIPSKNLAFNYDIQFKDMDFVNPQLKNLLGNKHEISGQFDIRFFTHQLPEFVAKNLQVIAKNLSYKTNIDISRDVSVTSEFAVKSFSFLDTALQRVDGSLAGKLSITGKLENPKIVLKAEIPKLEAQIYKNEQDKADDVNAKELKLDNLKIELKSQGFEKPEEVIPLNKEAFAELYKKHPYAAAVKRMQELYQSAVNYPVKLLFSLNADYMGEHSFVQSEIRLSPKAIGLGEGKKNFIEFNRLKGNVLGAGFTGNLHIDIPLQDGENYAAIGKFSGKMPHGKDLENVFFLPLEFTDLTYSLEFRSSSQKGQQILWQANAQKGSYDLYQWKNFKAHVNLYDIWRTGAVDSSFGFDSIELEDIGTVQNYIFSLQGPFSKMQLKSSFGGDAQFETKAVLSTNFKYLSGEFTGFVFEYPYKKTKLSLKKNAKFYFASDNILIEQFNLAVAPRGELKLDGKITRNTLDMKGKLQQIDLAYLPKNFKGIVNSHFTVSGTASKPQGALEILLKDFKTLSSPEMSFKIRGNIVEQKGEPNAVFSLTMLDKEKYNVEECRLDLKFPLTFVPILSVSSTRPIQGDIRYKGSLKTLWSYVPLAGRKLEGELDLAGKLSGTLSRPAVTMSAKSSNARYEDLLLGLMLTDLNFESHLKNGHGVVTLSSKDGRSGTVAVSGTYDIPKLYLGKYKPSFVSAAKISDKRLRERKIKQAVSSLAVVDLKTELKEFNPFYRNDFEATLSGGVRITEMVENICVDGEITVEKGEVHLENIRTGSIPKLNIVEDSSKRIRRRNAINQGKLSILVHILNNFGVYAPGLETAWKGDLEITGTVSKPAVKGILSAWNGSMNILGSVLKLNKGEITFNGDVPIVPVLDLKLEHSGNGVTSYITLKGMAYSPKLEMSSTPYLPSDEVLAHILFSRSMSELSDFEKIRLAAVLTSLLGFNINSGITDTTKNLFGLDVLSVDSKENSGGEEEISVQLGKYLRNNVYVGLEQEVNSPDTSGVLQYEINENLSVGTKVGTEKSEVGFKWKYDY